MKFQTGRDTQNSNKFNLNIPSRKNNLLKKIHKIINKIIKKNI